MEKTEDGPENRSASRMDRAIPFKQGRTCRAFGYSHKQLTEIIEWIKKSDSIHAKEIIRNNKNKNKRLVRASIIGSFIVELL